MMHEPEFTPPRRRVLAYIASAETFPSRREIADHMGWKNESSAGDVIRWLAFHGLVARSGGRSAWFVTSEGHAALQSMEAAQ